MTMDQIQSYKEHLTKTAAKVKSRNFLLSKLAHTTWGASASTKQTSDLALCYSVAEYCTPIWARSYYCPTTRWYRQLNNSMRLILGTIQPTQLPWLPVLEVANVYDRRQHVMLFGTRYG